MIALLATSQIAAIAGNAVGIIDKIYSQFAQVAAKNRAKQIMFGSLQVVLQKTVRGFLLLWAAYRVCTQVTETRPPGLSGF
jgi:hypothetical protein